MIKRMSKVTSILVAAAAVVSLIPATGVSAAQKLETKDGTIESAVAFAGGKYIYEGYKTDEDATGLYYNDGQKDKLVEDINSDSVAKYGDKYAKVVDGSDEYLVDLSNGSVSDDTSEDKADNVKTKLKTTLNKTDRYGKVDSTANVTLNEITTEQFGENWYYYTTTGAAATHSGYVSESGKYIDTDVTANIYVVSGSKTVKIDKFGEKDTTNNITVNLTDAKTIAEDSDNIYRIVKVDIVTADGTKQGTYIQKISKAQGETEDDAYIPKTVTSYEISTAYNSSDADDAVTAINDSDTVFRAVGGNIYATKNDGSKVTVTTIKLKKDKVALDGQSTKLDVYLAEKDVQEDQDIPGSKAVSIDSNGNTWAVNDGKIYEFDGTDFKVVYNVDRSMDALDVYDQNSLIAWIDGEDAYATIDGQDTTTPPVVTPVNKGWVNTASGWTFYNADGTQVKGQWVKDGGVWYYIKADGVMSTGWVKDGSTWYYLNASGAMQTGWVKDGSTWYYLNASGAMQTGWLNDNGTWYYLNASGAMLANTTVDGYKLNASGAWVK